VIALFEPLILALANGRARRDGTLLAMAFCPGAKARAIPAATQPVADMFRVGARS
jgi:hypothetical protein